MAAPSRNSMINSYLDSGFEECKETSLLSKRVQEENRVVRDQKWFLNEINNVRNATKAPANAILTSTKPISMAKYLADRSSTNTHRGNRMKVSEMPLTMKNLSHHESLEIQQRLEDMRFRQKMREAESLLKFDKPSPLNYQKVRPTPAEHVFRSRMHYPLPLFPDATPNNFQYQPCRVSTMTESAEKLQRDLNSSYQADIPEGIDNPNDKDSINPDSEEFIFSDPESVDFEMPIQAIEVGAKYEFSGPNNSRGTRLCHPADAKFFGIDLPPAVQIQQKMASPVEQTTSVPEVEKPLEEHLPIEAPEESPASPEQVDSGRYEIPEFSSDEEEERIPVKDYIEFEELRPTKKRSVFCSEPDDDSIIASSTKIPRHENETFSSLPVSREPTLHVPETTVSTATIDKSLELPTFEVSKALFSPVTTEKDVSSVNTRKAIGIFTVDEEKSSAAGTPKLNETIILNANSEKEDVNYQKPVDSWQKASEKDFKIVEVVEEKKTEQPAMPVFGFKTSAFTLDSIGSSQPSENTLFKFGAAKSTEIKSFATLPTEGILQSEKIGDKPLFEFGAKKPIDFQSFSTTAAPFPDFSKKAEEKPSFQQTSTPFIFGKAAAESNFQQTGFGFGNAPGAMGGQFGTPQPPSTPSLFGFTQTPKTDVPFGHGIPSQAGAGFAAPETFKRGFGGAETEREVPPSKRQFGSSAFGALPFQGPFVGGTMPPPSAISEGARIGAGGMGFGAPVTFGSVSAQSSTFGAVGVPPGVPFGGAGESQDSFAMGLGGGEKANRRVLKGKKTGRRK